MKKPPRPDQSALQLVQGASSRTHSRPSLPDRPRKLQGGGDDDNDGGNCKPPTPGHLQHVFEVIAKIAAKHPRGFHTIDAVASALWRRYVGVYGDGDDQHTDPEPFADMLAGARVDREAVEAISLLVSLKPAAMDAAVAFINSLSPARPAGALWHLQRALDSATTCNLSQSEVAQLAAHLSRCAAKSTGRGKDTQTTTDAASARLQVLADQFALLDYVQQQHVASFVAALANGTPQRKTVLRTAVRALLGCIFSAPDDLAYTGKACIDWIARKQDNQDAAGIDRSHGAV